MIARRKICTGRGSRFTQICLNQIGLFWSVLKTTSQSLLCYSAHIILNSPTSKDFHLVLVFRIKREAPGLGLSGARGCKRNTWVSEQKHVINTRGGRFCGETSPDADTSNLRLFGFEPSAKLTNFFCCMIPLFVSLSMLACTDNAPAVSVTSEWKFFN